MLEGGWFNLCYSTLCLTVSVCLKELLLYVCLCGSICCKITCVKMRKRVNVWEENVCVCSCVRGGPEKLLEVGRQRNCVCLCVCERERDRKGVDVKMCVCVCVLE